MSDKNIDTSEILGGINKVLSNVSNVVGKLGDLAEMGQSLKNSDAKNRDKDIKGVYGYSIQVGLNDLMSRVEAFGNIKTDESTGEPVVVDIRVPLVDISTEENCTVIEAEVPGVRADDLSVEVDGTTLFLSAQRGERNYQKEIELPVAYAREDMIVSCSSGIARIRCCTP